MVGWNYGQVRNWLMNLMMDVWKDEIMDRCNHGWLDA